MINGENAAYKAPKFTKPHIRTRNALIDDIINDFVKRDKEQDDDYASPSLSGGSGVRRGSFLPGPLLRRMSVQHGGGSPDTSDGRKKSSNEELSVSDDTVTLSSSGGFLKRVKTRKSKQLSVSPDMEAAVSEGDAAEDETGYMPPPESNGRKQSFFNYRMK